MHKHMHIYIYIHIHILVHIYLNHKCGKNMVTLKLILVSLDVAVCCTVLQFVAVCWSLLQEHGCCQVAGLCRLTYWAQSLLILQSVAVCVAMYCGALQCAAAYWSDSLLMAHGLYISGLGTPPPSWNLTSPHPVPTLPCCVSLPDAYTSDSRAHKYVHIQIYTYTNIYVYINTHIKIYYIEESRSLRYMYTYMHIYVYIHMYIYTYLNSCHSSMMFGGCLCARVYYTHMCV